MKDIENMLKQLAQLPVMIDRFNQIGEYLAHMEQGIVTLSTEGHATKLVNGLLFDLLVDKKVVDKDELNKLIEERVNVPMKEYIDVVNQRLQGQAEAIEEQIREKMEKEKPQIMDAEIIEPEEETDGDSNVVLASERFKKESEDE